MSVCTGHPLTCKPPPMQRVHSCDGSGNRRTFDVHVALEHRSDRAHQTTGKAARLRAQDTSLAQLGPLAQLGRANLPVMLLLVSAAHAAGAPETGAVGSV